MPSNYIPIDLKRGVLEYCRFLKAKDRSTVNDTAEVQSQQVDVIRRSFFQGTRPDIMPETVKRFLTDLAISMPDANTGSSGYAYASRA